MKKSTVLIALTLGTALMLGTTGCKHGPVSTTDNPGTTRIGKAPNGSEGLNSEMKITQPPEAPTTAPMDALTGPGFGTNSPWDQVMAGPHTEDREIFSKDTVYFDTDSSVIKTPEQSKLEDIAKYLKDNAKDVLTVEGYCDERGTEGYNMALGDRRSLAVREYLATLGVEAGRIHTVSFGEAKPVDAGHNESAWKQNRRGVSVLIVPKQ